MANQRVHDIIKEKLESLRKYWHKRSLMNWGVTPDQRTQFQIQIKHWGTHNAYLVFKTNVSRQQAEGVLNPIIEKLNLASSSQTTPNLTADIDRISQVLDLEKTQQANA